MAKPNVAGGLPEEKYKGFNIYRDDSGYYWSEGGYWETLAECRDDIDGWVKEYEPEPPDDTPSLPPPWWAAR